MKKTVKILKYHTVTFNDKFCSYICVHYDPCNFDFCNLFNERLDTDNGKQVLRCQQCLEATNEKDS